MRRTALATFVAVITAVGSHSASILIAQQPQQAKSSQFEVATIKPRTPGPGYDSHVSSSEPGGQFQMLNVPLKQWVKMGLSAREYALRAPAWLDTARFDLLAKLPTDNPANQKDIAEMMRALLIERFGLKWHEESQIVSGYELVPDKTVLIQPATSLETLRPHGSGTGPSSVMGTNLSMSEFADVLGEVLGRPIADATHLSGGYNIKLVWHPENGASFAEHNGISHGVDVNTLPDSVFTALREQLGLRLQTAKVPSKVIVVDNINRQPTAN